MEEKDELEEKALHGSCIAALTDSHSLVRLSNKVDDNMDVGLVRMSLPHRLVNGEWDAGGNGSV